MADFQSYSYLKRIVNVFLITFKVSYIRLLPVPRRVSSFFERNVIKTALNKTVKRETCFIKTRFVSHCVIIMRGHNLCLQCSKLRIITKKISYSHYRQKQHNFELSRENNNFPIQVICQSFSLCRVPEVNNIKMQWGAFLFVCLCFAAYSECKYKHHSWRENANEITTRPNYQRDIPPPPDHTKLIPMARYVLHNADWASLATISVLPTINGFPFSNVKSIVDGSLANSTGIPYFYMSPLDFSARDLSKNSRATVLVSLEETRYCESQNMDAEDPRCTRLMLSGRMKKMKEGTPEYTFAKAALFERHPAMTNFPPDHDWFVAKLKIAQIAMIDWFGGAKYIPVRDYLAYNYTGTEMLQYHKEHFNLN